MTPSLFSQSLFALDLNTAIEATARAGFPAIELACHPRHFSIEMARDEARSQAVASRIREAGIELSVISMYMGFTDPATLDEAVDEALDFLRRAPLFGTRLAKLTPGGPASADAQPQHWDAMGQAIERLLAGTAEMGLSLAFETHQRHLTDTLAGCERFLALSDDPRLGLTLDVCNLRVMGESLGEIFARTQGRYSHVHIKNAIPQGPGEQPYYGPIDEGMLDLDACLGMLRDSGYDGWLSVECLGPEARQSPQATAARDYAILTRCLERLRTT